MSIIKKHSTISEREEAEKKKIREKELQKKKADVEKKVEWVYRHSYLVPKLQLLDT